MDWPVKRTTCGRLSDQTDANQSKKLNEVSELEVIEAVLGRKKREFEEKFWDVSAKKEDENCHLPSVNKIMEKVDRICTDNNLIFRHKRPVAVESGCKKAVAKKLVKEKVECKPRRWESSDEEKAGPSQSQSEATCRATDKACSPRYENRGTRSTFDSSQAANSFLVEGLERQGSSKVEAFSEFQNEICEGEWGESFVWASPAARKQSENFGSENIAETLLHRHHYGAMKSKSQKRSDPIIARSVLDTKTLTDHPYHPKQAPFLKIINVKKEKFGGSPRPKQGTHTTSRCCKDGVARLTELDELLIKCIHIHAPTTQRRKSRFNFCQKDGQSPTKTQGLTTGKDLVESLINLEDGDGENSSTNETRSTFAAFVQQKLKFTKF